MIAVGHPRLGGRERMPFVSADDLEACVTLFERFRYATNDSNAYLATDTTGYLEPATAQMRLRALLDMYAATSDTSYLDDFVEYADSLLEMRDHLRGRCDYKLRSIEAWSFRANLDSTQTARVYETHGNAWVFGAMLEFADVVLTAGLTAYTTPATAYLAAAETGVDAVCGLTDSGAGTIWKDEATLLATMSGDTVGMGTIVPTDYPLGAGYHPGYREGWNRLLALAGCFEVLARRGSTAGQKAKFAARTTGLVTGSVAHPATGFVDALTLSTDRYYWPYHSTGYVAGSDTVDVGTSEDYAHVRNTIRCMAWFREHATVVTAFEDTDISRFQHTWWNMVQDQTGYTDSSIAPFADGTLKARDPSWVETRLCLFEPIAGYAVTSTDDLDGKMRARMAHDLVHRLTETDRYVGSFRIDLVAMLARAIAQRWS